VTGSQLLQHAATHCNTPHHSTHESHKSLGDRDWKPPAATHCNTLQHTATHCNTLQYTTTHYHMLQHTGTQHSRKPRVISRRLRDSSSSCHGRHATGNSLQYTTTRCNTLQHTATQHPRSHMSSHERYVTRVLHVTVVMRLSFLSFV